MQNCLHRRVPVHQHMRSAFQLPGISHVVDRCTDHLASVILCAQKTRHSIHHACLCQLGCPPASSHHRPSLSSVHYQLGRAPAPQKNLENPHLHPAHPPILLLASSSPCRNADFGARMHVPTADVGGTPWQWRWRVVPHCRCMSIVCCALHLDVSAESCSKNLARGLANFKSMTRGHGFGSMY